MTLKYSFTILLIGKLRTTTMDPKTKVTYKVFRELWHTLNLSYFISSF